MGAVCIGAPACAAPADAATRGSLAGAAFKPLAIRGAPSPSGPPRKGVLYAEQFIPGRGLVRWEIPADATPAEAAFQPVTAAGLRDGEWAGIDDLVYVTTWAEPFRHPDFDPRLAADFAVLSGQGAFAATAIPTDGKRGRSANPIRARGAADDAGRWFLFAAIRKRALGYRFPGDNDGPDLAFDRGGFVGQASAGLGWRRGGVQASLGYVYERVRFLRFGLRSRRDHRFGVTVSWRPQVATKPPIRWH